MHTAFCMILHYIFYIFLYTYCILHSTIYIHIPHPTFYILCTLHSPFYILDTRCKILHTTCAVARTHTLMSIHCDIYHISIYAHTHTYVYKVNIHTHTPTRTVIFVCTYTEIHTHIYICIHIFTHARNYNRKRS